MTQSSPVSGDVARPVLSMFDVYSGYVLTQGQNALMYVVMWERIMRTVAIVSLIVVAAFWLMPDAATGPQVLPLKMVLSIVLGGMALLLLAATRARPQYECQVDLIHCELRQVIRAASGIERQLLCVSFGLIREMSVQPDPDMPDSACLYMTVSDLEAPVLLGIGDARILRDVRLRLMRDLHKANTMAHQPRDISCDDTPAVGMQTA